jgi:hypothetical protein
MNTEWECPLCRTTNLVPAPICRVCRTAWPGIRARGGEPEEEEEPIPPLLASIPAPMALCLLALVLFFWWEPVTRPFSVPSQRSGWTTSVRLERHEQLRRARADLLALSGEMRATLDNGVPLPPDWNDRLSSARQHWQIYGEQDRAPSLGAVEVQLNSAVLELASIRFQLTSGVSPLELSERLVTVYTVLTQAGEELNNA